MRQVLNDETLHKQCCHESAAVLSSAGGVERDGEG